MNTISNRTTHIYDFHNSRFFICVKAYDLADAIDILRLEFGFDWVKSHIDELEVNWYKPNRK